MGHGGEPASRVSGSETGQRGGGACPRLVLFPAAPALMTPSPADRPSGGPAWHARHGEGPPPHPPTFAQQLLGKVSPRGLTQEQGPTATQGGKRGSRAGGGERPQRGAGLAKTLEEEGGPNSLALRLSSQQKLGVSRASRRVTTAGHPRRHPHRGGQTRDGPS